VNHFSNTRFSVLGLAGFHTYLVTSNLTTNEDMKGSFSGKRTRGNPFDFGSGLRNCLDVLCTPMPPTLIDARGLAGDESRPESLAFSRCRSYHFRIYSRLERFTK
jgi:palmitoyltransferase ZDHHC9/14/18